MSAFAGGGLGFSGGMALGMRLARPDRARVGADHRRRHAFHFSLAGFGLSLWHPSSTRIPILTVVLDNGGWQAVKSAVQRVYPKGVAAETNSFQSRLSSGRQGEQRRFADIGRAFGAHGEHVTEPDDLACAIDRCLEALDDGTAAVLHVEITKL